MRKVVFYSKNDMSGGTNLQQAEIIIRNHNPLAKFTINESLELYNIKLYFDNNLYLLSWSDLDLIAFKQKVALFWNSIVTSFSEINDENFVNQYESIDFEYKTHFWELIEKLAIYKRLNSNLISQLLSTKYFFIKSVLLQKRCVEHFATDIKKYFVTEITSAELLLSYYEEHHMSEQRTLYFPKELSDLDKENIISNYLEYDDANLNYVRLIVKSRHIKLSERTRLKAKKLSKKLNDEIIDKGTSWKNTIKVSIANDQNEPVKKSFNRNEQTYSYSKQFLLAQKDPIEVLGVFASLFEFINFQGCINLVSKTHEIDSIENIFSRSKSEYFISSSFHHKNFLAQAQFAIYKHFLTSIDVGLEESLSMVINDHLNKEFAISKLKISFPNKKSSLVEKIRMLAPEMEFLIKQYQSFVEDGFINFELLEFTSSPLNIGQVQSKLANKYVYGKGMRFERIRYDFFSNSSMLYYVDPYKEKYKNFYSLLLNENVAYEEFELFQRTEIDFLIFEKFLVLDDSKIVRVLNHDKIYAIGILHYENVLNLWHQPEIIRNEIIRLKDDDLLQFENTLFSNEERRYFNFHLNKKEFTNGLDLRNKYLHGTNSSSEQEQENDYNQLLLLLMLIVLKIEDDLYLYELSRETGANTG